MRLPTRSSTTSRLLALPALACLLLPTTVALAQQRLAEPRFSYSTWRSSNVKKIELRAAPTPRALPATLDDPAGASLRSDAQALLDRPGTTGLALLDGGTLVFAGLAKGAEPGDRFISYSMAKSLTSLAVGEALCAGHLKSLDVPAQTLDPALAGTAFGEASVRHLLMMASGAVGGDPRLSGQPYEGAYLAVIGGRKTVLDLLREHGERARGLFSPVEAGSRFKYNNLDTAALARVVAGSTGMPFPAWFQQAVVDKAGLAQTSMWFVDRDGEALADSSYHATLHDWARLALRIREVLRGDTDEPCLRDYLRDATRTQIRTGWNDGPGGYGYQFWTAPSGGPRTSFWMMGYGGQRIAFDPASDKILLAFAWAPEDAVQRWFAQWAR